VTFARPLLDTYNRWLYDHEGEVNDHRLPPELIGFYTRISMYVLKFAALYEIGTTERLEVSPQSMDYAMRLGDYLKSHLIQLVQDEMVTTKDGKELKTIKDLIRHEAGIDRQTLLKRSKLQANHLTELVDTLTQSGEVIVTREPTKGRPSFTYRLADD